MISQKIITISYETMTFLIAFAVQISASYQSQIEVLENTHFAALFHLLLFYLFGFFLAIAEKSFSKVYPLCHCMLQHLASVFYRVIKQSVTFFLFRCKFFTVYEKCVLCYSVT